MSMNNQSFGPPPPVVEMTVEQSFKLSRIEDLIPKASPKDLQTVLLALQRQNFALSNTIVNLLKHWPNSINDKVQP